MPLLPLPITWAGVARISAIPIPDPTRDTVVQRTLPPLARPFPTFQKSPGMTPAPAHSYRTLRAIVRLTVPQASVTTPISDRTCKQPSEVAAVLADAPREPLPSTESWAEPAKVSPNLGGNPFSGIPTTACVTRQTYPTS